jgi:hypothetical protein
MIERDSLARPLGYDIAMQFDGTPGLSTSTVRTTLLASKAGAW